MDYLLSFDDYLKDRKSPLTKKHYLNTVSHYLQYLKGEEPGRDNAEQFLTCQGLKGRGARSLNRDLAALKSLFKWILQKELILEGYRFDKKLPIWLDAEERKKFVAACQTPFETSLVSVLLNGGLRVHEAASLKINNVDQEGYLKIMGKGGREEIVAVPSETIRLINEYLSIRKEHSGLVFPRGIRVIQKLIKEIGVRARISKNVTPHTLRHSAATQLKDRGFDITEIRDQLRHQNISTTGIYVHSKPENIREKLERTS